MHFQTGISDVFVCFFAVVVVFLLNMSTHPEQICSYVPIEILCTCIGFALTAHCQAISYLVKIKFTYKAGLYT